MNSTVRKVVYGFIIVVLLIIVGPLVARIPWYWTALAVVIATVIGLPMFLAAWFWLGPTNRFFTFVSERTAKAIVKGGQFSRFLIQWEGHTLDSDGNVVEGREPWHPFGGLRFYGIWPIWDVFIYFLRWNDAHVSEERGGGTRELKFHAKWLDYVPLGPHVYATKINKAETTSGTEGALGTGERIPLDVEWVITMQVLNPYKAMFVAPPGWVEKALERLDAVLRGYITTHTLDQLLGVEGSEAEIWSELGDHHFIQQTLKQEWGVLIPENGIQIVDVTLPEDVQKAAQDQRVQQLRAQGTLQRVKIEADAEALRINTVYGAVAGHPLGQLIRTLEALERSPLAASLTVQMVPGLQEAFRGVFGRPPGETLTPEEIRLVRESLERQAAVAASEASSTTP